MKEYTCISDFYIGDDKFASTGDEVVILPDGTVVNKSKNQKTARNIKLDNEYFDDKEEDKVNHPSHYTWLKEKCNIEVIDITRHLDFCIGNAVKYLLRAGYKKEEGYINSQKEIEDLKKAIWYINDKIKLLENGN